MGTNYYLHVGDPAHCRTCTCNPPLHIGKSSGGWCFGLHVIPERGLNSLEDWKALLSRDNNGADWSGQDIRDEYDQPVSYSKLMDIITNRSWQAQPQPRPTPVGWEPTDLPGVIAARQQSLEKTERARLARSNAAPGPNGLLRHLHDGVHCVGHGEGTWDLMTGEFS